MHCQRPTVVVIKQERKGKKCCPIPPVLSNIPVGNTVFVDSVFGNDATGERENQIRPFLTLTAAENVAQNGDLILVRPGTYNNVSNLGTSGRNLNFYFETGSIINGLNDTPIFTFTNQQIIVSGQGQFNGKAFLITNSTVTIEFESILGSALVPLEVFGSSTIVLQGNKLNGIILHDTAQLDGQITQFFFPDNLTPLQILDQSTFNLEVNSIVAQSISLTPGSPMIVYNSSGQSSIIFNQGTANRTFLEILNGYLDILFNTLIIGELGAQVVNEAAFIQNGGVLNLQGNLLESHQALEQSILFRVINHPRNRLDVNVNVIRYPLRIIYLDAVSSELLVFNPLISFKVNTLVMTSSNANATYNSFYLNWGLVNINFQKLTLNYSGSPVLVVTQPTLSDDTQVTFDGDFYQNLAASNTGTNLVFQVIQSNLSSRITRSDTADIVQASTSSTVSINWDQVTCRYFATITDSTLNVRFTSISTQSVISTQAFITANGTSLIAIKGDRLIVSYTPVNSVFAINDSSNFNGQIDNILATGLTLINYQSISSTSALQFNTAQVFVGFFINSVGTFRVEGASLNVTTNAIINQRGTIRLRVTQVSHVFPTPQNLYVINAGNSTSTDIDTNLSISQNKILETLSGTSSISVTIRGNFRGNVDNGGLFDFTGVINNASFRPRFINNIIQNQGTGPSIIGLNGITIENSGTIISNVNTSSNVVFLFTNIDPGNGFMYATSLPPKFPYYNVDPSVVA